MDIVGKPDKRTKTFITQSKKVGYIQDLISWLPLEVVKHFVNQTEHNRIIPEEYNYE